MTNLKYCLLTIVATCLRMFPWPCKTGLYRIGDPDRDSPVIVTGNYRLTVARVKRALRGLDIYLLVANSRGINIWCAATGGALTNHDVISVLKTSGIENKVDHGKVILPQLAATGIEPRIIKEKTGWKGVWGPVYAKDIPAFLQQDLVVTRKMRQVDFPLKQRFEMAVAWGVPISVVFAAILTAFWKTAVLPALLLTWEVALLMFMTFPLYATWLKLKQKRVGFVLFDFGRGGIQLILLAVVLAVLAVFSFSPDGFDAKFMLRWGILSAMIVLLVSIDLMGSTPVYKSGLHTDRLLQVVIDVEKCKGAGFCEQVCPRGCFKVDKGKHLAKRPGLDRCVQCGACIVQCPFDSLFFKSPKGEIILPESIRKFKLNMMGKRTMNTVDR